MLLVERSLGGCTHVRAALLLHRDVPFDLLDSTWERQHGQEHGWCVKRRFGLAMAQQGQIVTASMIPHVSIARSAPHQRCRRYNSKLLPANAVINPLDVMRSASASVIWLLAGTCISGRRLLQSPFGSDRSSARLAIALRPRAQNKRKRDARLRVAAAGGDP